jgi:dolichyl-phosphate-mannose--protein O-mannosyl transferase
MRAKILSAVPLGAVVALLFVLSAYARGQATATPPATVTEAQLKSFARAYVQIEKIRDAYAPQLQQSQDPQKGMEIQNEAKQKIDEALAKEGMTAESYNQTARLVSADNALRSKVIEFIARERNKS